MKYLIIMLISFSTYGSSVNQGDIISSNKFNNSTFMVGDIKHSLLSIAKFQEIAGDCWVSMEGQDISGSDYATAMQVSNLPDARGVFLRSKNNGRADGNGDDEGERVLGSFQMDQMQKLTGRIGQFAPDYTPSDQNQGAFSISSNDGNIASNSGGGKGPRGAIFDSSGSPNARVSSSTDGETRVRNIAVNYFVKINNDCN